MMQYDYYAFNQIELTDSLNALAQAVKAVDEAKQIKDQDARRKAQEQAENQIEQAARKAVNIEPHLAYLWYDALDSEFANLIRDAWQTQLTASAVPSDFCLLPDISGICHLPSLSFVLSISFQLQKPYLSKDEHDFHLLDNPLRKDKVFQTPMVAATSWKGALRAALWHLDYKENHPVTIRLLGNPRESEEQQAGRLHFFPTFFDKIGLEVINPHDRQTGVGARGPILIECVLQGTKGKLLILYVPFGAFTPPEVAEDLAVLVEGIQAMLTAYGFGAKTSSGFGTAEPAGVGRLLVRAALSAAPPPVAPPAPQPGLPRYLESPTRLHPDLRREDGTLKSEAEYKSFIEKQGKKYGKRDKQLYDKAKGWWEREGQALAQTPAPEPEPEPPATPSVTEYRFQTWEELHQRAQDAAQALKETTI